MQSRAEGEQGSHLTGFPSDWVPEVLLLYALFQEHSTGEEEEGRILSR